MKLLTAALRKSLPALYSTERTSDPLVVAKYFTPDSSWTWYVTEGGPVDEDSVICSATGKPERGYLFFGLVDGNYCELGYFDLASLERIRGAYGLPVERDLYWQPVPLSSVDRRVSA